MLFISIYSRWFRNSFLKYILKKSDANRKKEKKENKESIELSPYFFILTLPLTTFLM